MPFNSSGQWDIGPLQSRPRPNLLSPPARLNWRPLLFLWKIIGPVGFEPTTSCTRNKRTTKLCYGPNELVLYPFRQPPERLNTSKSLIPEITPLPVLPPVFSGLCLPRTPVGATARMRIKNKLKNLRSKAKRKGT